MENETPAETFPKFLSVLIVMDRLDRNPPITAQEHDVEKVKKVTLVAAIGGLRTDLSLTSKTDGNFGNVATGVLFSKVAYQRKKDVYA